MEFKKVTVGNLIEDTKYATKGTRVVVGLSNPGWGNERFVVFLKTRTGRWIRKWERADRMVNFRNVTISSAHPFWDKVFDFSPEQFEQASIRERVRRLSGLRPKILGAGFEEKGVRR
jgi:hypothetical protein